MNLLHITITLTVSVLISRIQAAPNHLHTQSASSHVLANSNENQPTAKPESNGTKRKWNKMNEPSDPPINSSSNHLHTQSSSLHVPANSNEAQPTVEPESNGLKRTWDEMNKPSDPPINFFDTLSMPRAGTADEWNCNDLSVPYASDLSVYGVKKDPK